MDSWRRQEEKKKLATTSLFAHSRLTLSVCISPTKMKLNLSEFQIFLRRNGNKFPYNQVRKTRNTIYAKWLVLAAGQSSFVTLPSISLDKPTLNHLVMTQQAWPLPADMSEIIDYMECWGRGEDRVWYHNVVDWIAFICREGIKRDHLGLLYDCVALRVKRIIDEELGSRTTELTRRLLRQWREYFFSQFENGSTDFITVKRASIAFVRGAMSNINPTVPSLVSS